MCTVLPPPGVNPIAVNKYININRQNCSIISCSTDCLHTDFVLPAVCQILNFKVSRRRHVCISWLTNNVTICNARVCLWCNYSPIATQPTSPAAANKPNGHTSRISCTTCILPQCGSPVSPQPHIRSSAMFLSLSNLEVCHWLSSNGTICVKIRQLVQKISWGWQGAATPKACWFHNYKPSAQSAPTTKDQTMGGHVRATALCTVAPNICGPSVRNWLRVKIPAPRILRWHLAYRTAMILGLAG